MKTTVFDQLRGLIERLSPGPVCDECIAERLCLSATSQANAKERELAGANGFEPALGIYSLCDGPRAVIRRRVA